MEYHINFCFVSKSNITKDQNALSKDEIVELGKIQSGNALVLHVCKGTEVSVEMLTSKFECSIFRQDTAHSRVGTYLMCLFVVVENRPGNGSFLIVITGHTWLYP